MKKDIRTTLITLGIALTLFFVFVVAQINYSKAHTVYFGLDDFIYRHNCGYGYCNRLKDENGVEYYHCYGCNEDIYE